MAARAVVAAGEALAVGWEVAARVAAVTEVAVWVVVTEVMEMEEATVVEAEAAGKG